MSDPPSDHSSCGKQLSYPMLAGLSVLLGLFVGLVTGLFRLSLAHSSDGREVMFDWAREQGLWMAPLPILTCATATGLAAWLVIRYSPFAVGSGIPSVKATVEGREPPEPLRLLPVKFIGGCLAMGSGLALGREGPSVQMGASLGVLLSRRFGLGTDDVRSLMVSGAGAGLATAFNAPLAGALFVVEEVLGKLNSRVVVTMIGCSASAIVVSRAIVGNDVEFLLPLGTFRFGGNELAYLLLGLLAGLFGVLYSRAILWGQELGSRFDCGKVQKAILRAGLVGALFGILAWSFPHYIGGGEVLTGNALMAVQISSLLPLVFLVRFVLGVVSYSVLVPGGLFAPLLTLGAELGAIFALVWQFGFPASDISVPAAAMVGMAAFFTAVVRSPLTGIVLISEMTRCEQMFLPMLIASFSALLLAHALREPPIYDSLGAHGTWVPSK